MFQRAAAVVTTVLAAASLAPAGLQTMRFDMPSDLGPEGIEWHHDYFEQSMPGMITGARLIVDFDTQIGSRRFHDAADILFQFQLPSEDVPFWNVSGEDLGWSGLGRFSRTYSTDAFNGMTLIDRGDFVLWFGRIVSRNDARQFLGGTLTNSYWEFDIQDVPAPGAACLWIGAAACALVRRRRAPAS